jgi:DNA-binding response OmpR family regulator
MPSLRTDPFARPLPKGFAIPAIGSALPLQGLTILAVEDSRYACEALRLMCRRAGARLRRAETLRAARAHLRCYRPDVVIVDLGLPDGRGEALIRDLVLSSARPSLILGTSGNPNGRASALASGADGFLDKPLESLARFCASILSHLPGFAGTLPGNDPITPDPLALHDDLAKAARALSVAQDATSRRYVTGFIAGLARHAHDDDLAAAAETAGQSDTGLSTLRAMVEDRLAESAGPIGPGPILDAPAASDPTNVPAAAPWHQSSLATAMPDTPRAMRAIPDL